MLAQACTDINRSSQDGEAESTMPEMSKESPEVVPVSDLLSLVTFWPGRASAAEENKHTDTRRD